MGGKEKSADDVKGDAISKLLAGDVAGFDKELQETMRGPAGADIRRDHLREHIADHLFNGDKTMPLAGWGRPIPPLASLPFTKPLPTPTDFLHAIPFDPNQKGVASPRVLGTQDGEKKGSFHIF